MKVGNTYYWYDENKENILGSNGICHWGVRCYSSHDLYNLVDEGMIIHPVLEDKNSPLHPSKGMDRPHILFNNVSKQYVCWLKIADGYQFTRTCLVSDSITGPYKIVHSSLMPLDMRAGDFDLVASPDDGKAYMYFERAPNELICADMTTDFTNFSGYYSTHFAGRRPPLTREAPAHFQRASRHYLFTSGTTGYVPNPSEVATADTFHGPWTMLGDPHPGDATKTSYNSQISCVFKVSEKSNLWIAMADRWLGDRAPAELAVLTSAYAKLFAPGHPALTVQEGRALSSTDVNRLNTSVARYVWLPIRFDGEMPIIDWREEWSLDDFS